MRPSKPCFRRAAAVVAPASPAPTITNVRCDMSGLLLEQVATGTAVAKEEVGRGGAPRCGLLPWGVGGRDSVSRDQRPPFGAAADQLRRDGQEELVKSVVRHERADEVRSPFR